MKSFVLLLLCIGLTFSVFAQTTAEQLPLPNGPQLTGLAFEDSSLGFACGAGGRILKTTDSGNSWTSLATGTTVQINGLACENTQNVYACTEAGSLLMSNNGGQTWQAESISASPLTKIYFHHGQLFVLGETGNLYLNPHLDIGNLVIPIGGNWANLDQMFWINDQIGFLMADSTHAFAGKTILFKTTNGGSSWERGLKIQSSEGNWTTDTLYRDFYWLNLHHIIRLPDSSLLMAGGYYPGYIWKSTDLGQTFHIVAQMTQCNPIQIESFGPGKVALISREGDALFPYIAKNRNGELRWAEWLSDSGIFQLPYPFKHWGKATFFGSKLGFLSGYNQNINGTFTGAILRVRNVFYETVTKNEEEINMKKVQVLPNPASKEVCLIGLNPNNPVSLYSAQGQKLETKIEPLEKGIRLEVSALPSGLYFVKWDGGLQRFFKE